MDTLLINSLEHVDDLFFLGQGLWLLLHKLFGEMDRGHLGLLLRDGRHALVEVSHYMGHLVLRRLKCIWLRLIVSLSGGLLHVFLLLAGLDGLISEFGGIFSLG